MLTPIEIAGVIFTGFLIVFVGVLTYRQLQDAKLKAKTPAQIAVINALIIWVGRAIRAGDTIAEHGLEMFGHELDGLDKAAVANALYNILPDHIYVEGIPISIEWVKELVPPDKFEVLVENEFQAGKAFILRNMTYLQAQVDQTVTIPPSSQTATVG